MKRSKFTEVPIAFILRQADEGTVVGEVCRKAGISEATFYNSPAKPPALPERIEAVLRLREKSIEVIGSPWEPRGPPQCHRIIIS
jgi:putative transposase